MNEEIETPENLSKMEQPQNTQDLLATIEEQGKQIAAFKKAKSKAQRRFRREEELKPYQAELIQMQQHLEQNKRRMIILFEGRDAAGKGGTIRRVTRYMNEKHYRVVALGKPTEEQKTQWFFQKYIRAFPRGGEVVLFDRSWYNRAIVEPVFDFCTKEEYENFMVGCPGFEKDLVRQGTILIKLYFSVTKEEQARRFERRKSDPLRQWKLSEIDVQAQDRWDERIRALEAKALAETGPRLLSELRDTLQPTSSFTPPALGERREFKVLKADGGFDQVKARVRYVSDHSLVYVDEAVPSGGFTDEDLEGLALEFEGPVYSTITGAFGSESDLDDNDRIIILFTAAVNRLTKPASDGFVGGFFFGLDLMEGRTGSNGGEVFYALVPDPVGQEGPAISRYTALSTIPAVLAHEFEHMVHFNQRMLLRGAESQEALWLSEALAQMAEDLVGAAFEEAREPSKALQYRVGNWIRARRFLGDPSQVSVLSSLSPGTLAERGAGWLLLKQVSGRPGQVDLLRTLVSSAFSGTENLTRAVGVGWKELAADWAGSLFLDGTTVPVRPELRVAGVNLRAVLSESDGTYPLRAMSFGGHSALFSGTLWSSSPNYFIISPPAVGGLALSASGPMGGVPEAAMGLQVLLVRLQ